MGYIAAYFAHRVADIASHVLIASHELDDRQTLHAELCGIAGIEAFGSSCQNTMISDTAFFDLLEYVANNVDKGESIAIRVGATMQCDDYGAFGLAFKTASNLSGSFQRVERYGKVVTTIANYQVIKKKQSAFMSVKKDPNSRLGLFLTNELAVAAATSLCREVSSEAFAPKAVHFSHSAPRDISDHEDYFRCPVIFDSEENGLEIGNDWLFAGNRLGDQAVSAFFDSHLDNELAHLVDVSRIDQRVVKQIIGALSEGAPSIQSIARQLGLSGRTLQRRLGEEGLVYQELVDGTRRDLAASLLQKNEYSLAEVAFLTGYAEQSTFTRAFKRWYGQTPASYRRAMR